MAVCCLLCFPGYIVAPWLSLGSVPDELLFSNSRRATMKKFLLGTVALIALGATAHAADLPARVYAKAPVVAPVLNWTGFYIGGGFGYGMWDADQHFVESGFPYTVDQRYGGRGWFGTVSGGYDWQLNQSWVVGVFGDAQFTDISGTIGGSIFFPFSGKTKNDINYAAGVRVGYLIAPNVLSYVNGGWSHAEFKGADLLFLGVTPAGMSTGKLKQDGWFLGGGFENTLNMFGISAPGWFLKTEYRLAEYGRKDVGLYQNGYPVPAAISFKPYVQTISTQLVYKFNWGR
jgi:outer membrane immunogenic protein